MPKGYPKTEEGRRKQREILAKHAFKKGVVSNPHPVGRPKKTMRTFIDEMEAEGYECPSPEQISKSFLYLGTLPEEKLKEVLADKERPMMQRIIAKGILANKGIDILERIIDRAYGKVQRIDLTSKGEQIKQPEPLQIHFVANSTEYNSILDEIQKTKEQKDAESDRE